MTARSDGGATPTTSRPTATDRVSWGRVGLFYAIAFGGAWIVGGALALLAPGQPQLVLFGAMGLFYMTLPLVAGLVVERVARRPRLIGREWAQLRSQKWQLVGRIAWVSIAAYLMTVVGMFAAAAVGSLMGLPGAGELLTSTDAIRDYFLSLAPAGTDPATVPEMPPIPVILAFTLLQSLVAGFTVNGLFAFGEEYGWRGVLADELEPLGAARATVLIGILWGLWHAPVILLLGHNYGDDRAWGVLVMVVWMVPFSFLLRWTRRRSGSVFAPAVVHGAVNGFAGLFALFFADASRLVQAPAGLLGALGTAIAAAVVWAVWPVRAPQSARP